jgi:hypothetical protein
MSSLNFFLSGMQTAFGPIVAAYLALLWQINSRRCLLLIRFLQCGHRCVGRAMSSRMAWRMAAEAEAR